jgi:phosphotriesterase-related protein
MTKIRTVLGDIPSDDVGNIMMHEHVLFDISLPESNKNHISKITTKDRWQVNYLSNRNPENACQKDIATAVDELGFFRQDGGSLIVDQSVFGLDRDPEGLAKVSKLSGVHIVASAGCYTEPYLPKLFLKKKFEELVSHFIQEVDEGLDGTSVKAGIIGEIGCSWPITSFEVTALKAASIAAKETGCALSVHPGRASESCSQILDIVTAMDLNPSRVILCHMDRTFPSGEGIEALLDKGVNVEWDFFGIEQSYYWMGNVELPNDFCRLRLINKFADAGYSDQILISHDICTKTRMRSFGGHGYSHIIRNIPELLSRLGFDINLLKKLIHENPKNILTFEEL